MASMKYKDAYRKLLRKQVNRINKRNSEIIPEVIEKLETPPLDTILNVILESMKNK